MDVPNAQPPEYHIIQPNHTSGPQHSHLTATHLALLPCYPLQPTLLCYPLQSCYPQQPTLLCTPSAPTSRSYSMWIGRGSPSMWNTTCMWHGRMDGAGSVLSRWRGRRRGQTQVMCNSLAPKSWQELLHVCCRAWGTVTSSLGKVTRAFS